MPNDQGASRHIKWHGYSGLETSKRKEIGLLLHLEILCISWWYHCSWIKLSRNKKLCQTILKLSEVNMNYFVILILAISLLNPQRIKYRCIFWLCHNEIARPKIEAIKAYKE